MQEKISKILKSKFTYLVLGLIAIFLLIVFVLIPLIQKVKIDEKWRTDKITITLADGSSFDVEDRDMLTRIQKYCNDGLFRPVKDNNKVDGSCAIWVDFNNGTIIGMFQTRDYGYVGDTKQYIGDATYLPSGFNEFIRNLIKLHINYHFLSGEITDIYKLGYILKLDENSIAVADTDTIFASSENMTFSDIKNLNFEVGDVIKVYYNGDIIDSYPAQIYMSSAELIQSKSSKEKEETLPVLKLEDIEDGYEIKDDVEYEVEVNSYDFKQIMFNDTSITGNIPNWVIGESSMNKLYSINNIDFLVDIVANDNFSKNLGPKWTKEQKEMAYLGQGIKCFNLDDDRIFYYYPIEINGNVVGLLELEETKNAEYFASFTTEFVNGLNEIATKTSEDTPLILFRYQNNICGLVDNTVYAENDIDIRGVNLPEITRSSIVNVLEELSINDVSSEDNEALDSENLEENVQTEQINAEQANVEQSITE